MVIRVHCLKGQIHGKLPKASTRIADNHASNISRTTFQELLLVSKSRKAHNVARIASRVTFLWFDTARKIELKVPIPRVLWSGTAMRWCNGSSVSRLMWLPA